MAKKFSINQNPTFTQVAKIPRIGGDPIAVEFTYKYFTRPQLTALNDQWSKARKELVESWDKAREEGTLQLADMNEGETGFNVNQLKDVLLGWAFDEEFNEENIRALVESSIGATDAVLSAYNEAYEKAKLGN